MIQTTDEVLSRLPRPSVPRLPAPAYTGLLAYGKRPEKPRISGPEQRAVTPLTGPTRQAVGGPIMSEHTIPSEAAQQPAVKTCSVEGCDGPVYMRGWCCAHYQRWLKRGHFHLPTPVERFWNRVNKSGPVHPVCGQCWAWTGKPAKSGYGVVGIGKRHVYAHRFSWGLHFGEIPEGLCVLHRCDNRVCVNPDHLFLGTHTDNSNDKMKKGRQPAGEQLRHAILTAEKVKEIRERYKPYDKQNGPQALADEFGVSYYTVIDIARGRNWKHVT